MDEALIRGTSGEMVFDILADWQIERIEMLEAEINRECKLGHSNDDLTKQSGATGRSVHLPEINRRGGGN